MDTDTIRESRSRHRTGRTTTHRPGSILFAFFTGVALCLTFFSSAGAASVLKEIGLPAGSSTPWGVALDDRGNEWVAVPMCDPKPFLCGSAFAAQIMLVDRASFTVKQVFQQPAGFSSPFFLAPARDGSIW